MLIRTHIVITALFILIFLSSIQNKIVFAIVALIATLMPDIDSDSSIVGKRKIFRPIQFLFGHRGFLHSFTFLFLLTIFFVLFIPVIAFPLFLGYSLHLFADSFTVQGIRPFYPLKRAYIGKFKTGGKIDMILFISILIIDLFVLSTKILGIF
jgi:inner membrane protein